MKFRTFIRPLAIVAALVLAVGLALLARLTLNTPLDLIDRGGQVQPQALQFVPKQSPVVASVLVRPDRLATLWEYLAAPGLRQGARRDQAQIEQLLLANTGLSYSRDIEPWLGEEITTALVTPDLDLDPTNGITPGYLVALVCRDSAAAQAALELYWQNRAIAGDALTFEDFSGNRLIYARPGDHPGAIAGDTPLATALVANRFVLAANHPEVLRQALTAAQAKDLNLQSDRRYKTALRQLPPPRVGLLAINLPALERWLQANDHSTPVLAGQALADFDSTTDRVDWGLASWQLTRQGLVGHTALLAAPGHRLQPRPVGNNDWATLSPYLPESLAVAALGSNLADLGRALAPLMALVGGNPGLSPLDNLIDTTFGRGAAALVRPGVEGAYAVGLATTQPSPSPADWLLVAPQSPALTTALQSLTALAETEGVGVGALDLHGTPTQAWTRLSLPPTRNQQRAQVVAEVVGLRALVEGYEVLAADPNTLDAVISPLNGARHPPAWWTPLADEIRRSTGIIHLDWRQIEGSLGAQFPRWRLWETAAQPALKHLRQVTLVSGDRSESMQTGSIVVQVSNQLSQ
jgi:hypothetical protein